jgi:hypothetical protein
MTPQEAEQETLRALTVAKPMFETLALLNTSAFTQLLATIKPREGDLERAFDPRVAPQLAPVYDALWGAPPRSLGVAREQTELRIAAATTKLLSEPNPIRDAFPGGYARMAALLAPERVWIAWKYVRPGASAGMAFDGLVFLDDHWAWFPKPWRGLKLPPAPESD